MLNNVNWSSIKESGNIIGQGLHLVYLSNLDSEIAQHQLDKLMNDFINCIGGCTDEPTGVDIAGKMAYISNMGNIRTRGLNLLEDIIHINEPNITPEDKLKLLVKMNMYCKYYFNNNFSLMDSCVTGEYINMGIIIDNGTIDYNFTLTSIIIKIMVGLTPEQIYQVFPIKKVYYGEKYGIRDYYDCMEEVNKLGLNIPLETQEQVINFIMECTTNKFFIQELHRLIKVGMEITNTSVFDILDKLTKDLKKENKLHIVK